MDLKEYCHTTRIRIAKELLTEISPERKALLLGNELQGVGGAVLKALNALAQAKGIDSPSYQEAQTAVAELFTFLVLPFVGSCSDHKHGVTILEDLADLTNDVAMKNRLVTYATQIKRRWNDDDPSALPINPRAAKTRIKKTKRLGMASAARMGVCSVVVLWVLMRLDFTSLVLPGWSKAPLQLPVQQEFVTVKEPVVLPGTGQVPVPPADNGAARRTPDGTEYYAYTDKKGVVHLGNRSYPSAQPLPQVAPPTAANSSHLTPVVINGNQVLVPITVSYRGRAARATLLLDTGATVTTINEHVAALLGVKPEDMVQGASTVADGRRVVSSFFKADSLTAGPRTLYNPRTCVLKGSGGAGHDGLLGMDFLKNFRYHVDFNRSVIEWGES